MWRVIAVLLPRGGTADEIAVCTDGDRVGKLAAGGKVAGKEMWECESMEMVGWWNEKMVECFRSQRGHDER